MLAVLSKIIKFKIFLFPVSCRKQDAGESGVAAIPKEETSGLRLLKMELTRREPESSLQEGRCDR